MKAYVIRNKKGKYFAGFDRIDLFTTEKDISKAVMYRADRYEKRELETAPEFKDCSVLEITIAEGDLEKQLAEKDKEIERLKKIAGVNNLSYLLEREQEVRHQVCEDLREWLKNTVTKSVIGKKFIFEKLKQIEQGEK